MKNRYYHKYISLYGANGRIKYYLDYIQTYFPIPLDDLKKLDGFNLEDINTWIKHTVRELNNCRRQIGFGDTTIKIQEDLKYKGIKFHFKGKFFESDNYVDDLKHLKNVHDKFYSVILESQYNPPLYSKNKPKEKDGKIEWKMTDHRFLKNLCTVKFPHLYISRFDMSENLYFKYYPNGFEKDYEVYSNQTMKNNKNCMNHPWMETSNNSQTGHTFGVLDFVKLTVYSKIHDVTEGAYDKANQRFGTEKFYRREYQVRKRKIKSMGLNHYENFLKLIDDIELMKYTMVSLRKTCDIVLHDDNTLYWAFHQSQTSAKNIAKMAKDVSGYTKRILKNILIQEPAFVPLSHRSTMYWDGVDNIIGIARAHKHKWTHDKWLRILDELLKEPERLPFNRDENKIADMKKVYEFLHSIKYK